MDNYKPWGKMASIDLFGCDHTKLIDPEQIKTYILEVIKVINMVPHGPCHIERFGSGSLEGYSAMQFIETSSITVHSDEVENRVFIDIFSCKDFDENLAISFSKNYFVAADVKSRTFDR